MYKNSKWAQEIIEMQRPGGTWGYFHTLSEPKKHPITTEQALRRLLILGFTIDDEPIQKCLIFMSECLAGKKEMPDRREKTHDWDIFTELMLSTWMRKFTQSDTHANHAASKWSTILSHSFSKGAYDDDCYKSVYTDTFGKKPQGGRLVDFVSFYQVSLTANTFDEKTEKAVFDYILNHQFGIYYTYDRPISIVPEYFASKQASRYLGAIEILSAYRKNKEKLNFVVDWLNRSKNADNRWDMGSTVNDKVHFPLSDNWRIKTSRELDCTYRVQNLLDKLSCAK